MRIGVFVSETWDSGSDIDEIRVRARSAEQHGLASGWVPYLPWSLDALASLQAAGEVTQRIELGSAVIPTYLIHPLALARQAATTQAAVGRPITLGIGCSNVAVVEMHGLAYQRPARHVRETLELLHAAAGSEGQVGYQGELFQVASMFATPGTTLGPILVGALGPQMLHVAGTLSDGTIATWSNEVAIESVIGPGVRDAAKAAGRPEPRVAAVVPVTLTSDSAGARERVREHFAVYDGLPRYKRMVELGGARSAAEVCVVGDEREVRGRLRRFANAGLTDFLAAPFAAGGERTASWEDTTAFMGSVADDYR